MLRQCVNLLRQCQRFWRRRIFEWLVLFILVFEWVCRRGTVMQPMRAHVQPRCKRFNLSANSAFAWSDGIAKILLCPSADAFIQMIDIYRISFTMIPIRSMSGLFSTCSKNEHG